MSTIFQAPQFDPGREKRRRNLVLVIIAVAIVVGVLFWTFRFWPQEHKVDQFFTALQQKDYEKAYGIYMNDPDWKQHPQKDSRYAYADFYNDWGPGGEWGSIKSHHVDGAVRPSGGGSGVVVQVTINGRPQPARIWVDKDKTLTYPSPA